MELVSPSIEYKRSYLAAAKELVALREFDSFVYGPVADIENDFDRIVMEKLGRAEGKYLNPGWVPSTELWLIDGGEYIGSVRIRHTLNELLRVIGGHIGYDIRPSMRKRGYGKAILKLALPHAKALGIDRVLVTCDETNIGSRKIIEASGGVYENKVPNPDGGPDKLRFWIEL